LFANSRYDCGDILGQKSTEFEYPLKIWDAIQKLQPLYFDLLVDVYERSLLAQPLSAVTQDETKASYSLWLDDLDYFIDWKWPAEKIARFVDAVGFPYAGARAHLGHNEVILNQVDVIKDVYVEHRSRHIGKVIFLDEGVPVVVCSKGLLAISELTTPDGENVSINFRSRFA
jgi:methionyl-tRNA formyltransferase